MRLTGLWTVPLLFVPVPPPAACTLLPSSFATRLFELRAFSFCYHTCWQVLIPLLISFCFSSCRLILKMIFFCRICLFCPCAFALSYRGLSWIFRRQRKEYRDCCFLFPAALTLLVLSKRPLLFQIKIWKYLDDLNLFPTVDRQHCLSIC